MNKSQVYRDNGAIGALLDEYEKALVELKKVIEDVASRELIKIVDKDTKDKDCESIQSILSHVVKAGHNYVLEIRSWLGEEVEFKQVESLNSSTEYIEALDKMFVCNEELFDDYPQLSLEEHNPDNKIKVRWGQKYDVEQLYEHAIVHILRHRRQIERFKEKIETYN